MKQKDIALYIIVAISSATISVIASNYLITPNKIKKQESEVVSEISPEFNTPKPNDKYFNKNSIDPTKIIQIGDNNNQDPIQSKTR